MVTNYGIGCLLMVFGETKVRAVLEFPILTLFGCFKELFLGRYSNSSCPPADGGANRDVLYGPAFV